MIIQLVYVLLAVLGLGFLVFIHELGHYFVAKRVGMTIEVFSIGFGKPIYSWMRGKVKWQIGSLPFGGYVKIKGMQEEKGKEPHEIPDGFFGKKPIDRIKVAIMGPLVNIVFALIAFALLFLLGGREKSFSEYTHRIGYVDEKSKLFELGVRPGDEIVQYDNRPFSGIKDLLYSGLTDDGKTRIQGYKIDYFSKEKMPFDYTLNTYEHPSQLKEGFSTIGVLAPSNFLIYNTLPGSSPNPLLEGSPLVGSGIDYGDRILWVDGELIFSNLQLAHVLNDDVIFLTVQRGATTFQTQIPRIKLQELNLSKSQKNELDDWRYELSIKDKLSSLYFIPYNLSSSGVVESRLHFIDPQMQKEAFIQCYRCRNFLPLQKGDKIIAVGGKRVRSSYEILEKLQNKTSVIIVQKHVPVKSSVSWQEADNRFDSLVNFDHLQKVIASIGTDQKVFSIGNIEMLSPVELKTLSQIQLDSKTKQVWEKQILESKKQIAKIEDAQERKEAFVELDKLENKLALGISLQDQKVSYNPNPLTLFKDVFSEMQRTLTALVTGYLSPKYLSGPVGIMQAVHHGWASGYKEALFWLGMISLNLGLLNLLPIPVLDGGHIVFSFYEMATKKPIKAKMMERLIIPFVVLLIGFFIYVTYHDITRLFQRFF